MKNPTILVISYSIPYVVHLYLHVSVSQEPDVKEEWNRERENISQLQAQIQRLEQENTDFLAALEDAMEQYKQQVREFVYIWPSSEVKDTYFDVFNGLIAQLYALALASLSEW